MASSKNNPRNVYTDIDQILDIVLEMNNDSDENIDIGELDIDFDEEDPLD